MRTLQGNGDRHSKDQTDSRSFCFIAFNLIEVLGFQGCRVNYTELIMFLLRAVSFDKFVFQILVPRKCSYQRLVEAEGVMFC